MSEYEETRENEGYKCPYCGQLHICDDWGFDYLEEVETCEECGKKFKATALHSVDFIATPNCELNGEEHKIITKRKINVCKVCEQVFLNSGVGG